MNVMVILLVIYVTVQTFEYWLKFANLSHMKRVGRIVPEGFEDYVDHAVLQKTHAYTLEHSKLSLAESLFVNIIIIVFLFGGLLNLYNSWIVSLGFSFVTANVLFFLLLTYAGTILSLPFSLFSTFKIENRYGFNTMTLSLWLKDFLKSVIISTLLIGILLFTSFTVVQKSPHFWWFFVWLFFFLFSIFLMYVSPYIIEPLFNKFSPLDGHELESKIRNMMNRAGLSVSRVFQMDASRRSTHTNAYFTGIGKVKRIVLYDTLMEKMEHGEILAVLAHELGHWKKRHVIKRIAVFEAISFGVAYVSYHILETDFLARLFLVKEPTFAAKLAILGFILSLVSFPFTPVSSYFSRRQEEEADRYSAALTSDPESLATSLIKLSKDNLSNLHPHPLYAKFYYSHPPVVERVNHLKSLD